MGQLMASRHGIETWLMEPGPYLLKRCPAAGPWQQLVAWAEQFRALADLRWRPKAPYGIAGFRRLRKDAEWTELELDFVEGNHLSGPHAQAAEVALRCCELLARVHERGQWHGDLSPSNVLLTPEGAPVLIDFGHQQTYLEGSAASLRYAAPERLGLLERTVGPASDVYSLALVLYELWTGRAVIDSESAAEVLDLHMTQSYSLDGVPARVREWLQGALHLEPSRRYRDAGEMQANWLLAWEGGTRNPSVYVGRTAELELADEVWRRACQGQASWLIVRGDSGLGKTRFVHELAQRWGVRRLYGQAAPTLAPASYEPLRSALTHLRKEDLKHDLEDDAWYWLKQMFPGLENLHPGERLELSLEHSMGRIAPESARALAELGGALGYPGGPLLLILDDLQWADEQVWELLANWSQQPLGDVLVCLSSRCSVPESVRIDAEIELPPLEFSEQLELLEHLLPGGDHESWLREMGGWVRGNPFYLNDLVRARQGKPTRIPLESAAPPALQKVALVGRRFPRTLLEPQILDEALAHRWVWLDGGEVCFSHDQIRDRLLQDCAEEQKRRWHSELADEWPNCPAGARGLHLWHAGRAEESLPHLLEGAQQAMREGQFSLARPLWEAAVQLSPSGRAHLGLADCLNVLGHLEEALTAVRGGLTSALSINLRVVLHQKCIQLNLSLGHDEVAMAQTGHLMSELPLGPALWGWLENAELNGSLLRAMEQSMILCAELSDPKPLARIIPLVLLAYWRGKSDRGYLPLATIFLVSSLMGYPQKWLKKLLDQAVPSIGDPILAAFIRGRLAAAAMDKVPEALAVFHDCEPYFQISSEPFEFSSMTIHLQWFTLMAGNLQETRERARRNLARARREDDTSLMGISIAGLAWADSGQLSSAMREIVFGPTLGFRPVGQVHQAIAQVCCEPTQGLAIPLLRKAFKGVADRMVATPWLATALRLQALSWSRLAGWRRQAQLREAEFYSRRAISFCAPIPFFKARALREYALARLALGQEQVARDLLREAVPQTIALENQFELSHLYREYGQAAQLLGWEEADRLNWEGAALDERIGMRPTAPAHELPSRLKGLIQSAQALLRGEAADLGSDSLLGRTLLEGVALRRQQAEQQRELDERLVRETSRLRTFTEESSVGLAWLETGELTPQNSRWDFGRGPDQMRAGLALQWPQDWRQWRELQAADRELREQRWQRLRRLAADCRLDLPDPSETLEIPDGLAGHFDRLSSAQREACLGVLREAMSNARKHAPGAKVWLNISREPNLFSMVVSDDGPGLGAGQGFGMSTMEWRARLVGGHLRVESQPGTRVTLEIPNP